jgi:hypothetical protein
MNKSYVKKLTVIGAAAAAGAGLMTLLDTGVAGASPDVSGKTFSEAQAALKRYGYTAAAMTAVGDKTAQSDCKVVRQQDINTPTPGWPTSQLVNGVFVGGDQPTLYPGPGFGDIPTTGQVLLTLDCYPAGDAGLSHPTGSGDINTKKAR